MRRLTIDGSHGEGGGQILRTALGLSVVTGRVISVENVRAGRRKPGLAPQHLSAVRAAAAICAARVSGAALGSTALTFEPTAAVRAGAYAFDVADAASGGSAGSALLILQTVLVPLAFAGGSSDVVIRGGTHVPWSPASDYVRQVWLPALAEMGIAAGGIEERTGWYPIGEGIFRARIESLGGRRPAPFVRTARGAIAKVHGRALAANLPHHIPNRMADRAGALLAENGIETSISVDSARASCQGAGLFLLAEYHGGARAGFFAFGKRGKTSERVAEEAVEALLEHDRSGAAVDHHLADQLVLPCALASGASAFTATRASAHLTTNLWVVEQFGLARGTLCRTDEAAVLVRILPRAMAGD